MIFPGARLGQVVGPQDPLRSGELADVRGDVFADLLFDLARLPSSSPCRVTNATIAWPVSSSDCATTAASATFSCATIADSTSAVESRWPETLITSSIAPDDPEVPVLVADRRVADEVRLRPETRPVGLDVALIVAVEGAEHRRPRPLRARAAPVLARRARRSVSSSTSAATPGSG